MADHSKHEHGCGCGEKAKAVQEVKPDFTLDPAKSKVNEAACCGHHAAQVHGDDPGCGGAQAKQPKTKAKTESGAGDCCGAHGHD